MYNLSDRIKLIKVKDHSTAAQSAVTSDAVDMRGYSGVLFVTSFGVPAADNTICASQDPASGGSYDDLLGTAVVSGTSADVWVDIVNPRERYVRLEAARGTSSTLESIWAILYGAAVEPVSNLAVGTLTGEVHLSPAEGTA